MQSVDTSCPSESEVGSNCVRPPPLAIVIADKPRMDEVAAWNKTSLRFSMVPVEKLDKYSCFIADFINGKKCRRDNLCLAASITRMQ